METDYRFVMVSNQDGLGTPAFPLENFLPLQQLMLQILEGEGVRFDEVLIDGSFPEEPSYRRKPSVGMVEKYLICPAETLMIGDTIHDAEVAKALGFDVLLYTGGHNSSDRLAQTAEIITQMNQIPDFLDKAD